MKKEIKVPDLKAGKKQEKKVRLGIDLTLCEKDWLPDARNARIAFTARIYTFNEKDKIWRFIKDGKKGKVTFSLKDVSKEKGVCMNYPKEDLANDCPDLFFPDDDQRMRDFDLEDDVARTTGQACRTEILAANDNPAHRHHYKKATTKKDVTEATVIVRCEDYGAFGTLEASVPDCETIPPRERDAGPSKGAGPNDVKIPRDNNGNDIADSADQDKYSDGAVARADQDSDAKPVTDGHDGDGLTNYEEYRGFIVKEGGRRKHLRTDIDRKDIFIYDRDHLRTGYFWKSGLMIHFIPEPDFYNGDSADRDATPDAGKQVINFNRGHATGGEQHGIRLVKEDVAGYYGYTFGDGPGLPKVTNRVAIHRDDCDNSGIPNQLESTITHELGHSVNVFHHGDRTNCPNHTPNTTESIGGEASGDVSCVMRYDNYHHWCHPSGASCHRHERSKKEDVGTIFCNSRDGTGVNAHAHANNDATVGNCKSHIRVKDW